MRKIVLSIVFVISVFALSAQNVAKVKDTKEVTWFGVDFTQAKMVGSETEDFTNPKAIVDKHFEGWNLLFLNEVKKYNLERTFRKKVRNKVSQVTELNKAVDPAQLVTYDHNRLNPKDIEAIVAQYKNEEGGMGLTFAVENFEKAKSTVRFYVVFFDIATGEVLLSEYVESKAIGGITFKNYWASGFYYAMRRVKKEYPIWIKTDKKALKEAAKAKEIEGKE